MVIAGNRAAASGLVTRSSWLATDFERDDDVPVSSVPLDPGDCRGFSLGAYAVEDLIHGNGNIQVKP